MQKNTLNPTSVIEVAFKRLMEVKKAIKEYKDDLAVGKPINEAKELSLMAALRAAFADLSAAAEE